jgi:regulatory protein
VADRRSAYLDALHLLARRELSVAECRARLLDRDHSAEEVDAAIAHLVETGALDDGRVARAHSRTALTVKGRGRLRIQRELHARGIPHEVAAEALADALGESDERTLVSKALQKKLRGRTRLLDRSEYARLYQFLMRQGFTPGAIRAELRRLTGARIAEE